jgi:hypothetical protein
MKEHNRVLASAMPGRPNPSTLKSGGGMGGGLVTPGSTLKGMRPGATSPQRGIGALGLGAKSGGRTKPSVAASLASGGAKQKEKDNMGMASWDWKRVKAHMEVGTRGLHSSTFRLNLSAFCGIGVHSGVV